LFKSAPTLARYAVFKSAVLVGKSNYLCTTRLAHALADRASLFTDADYDELQRIATWAEATDTGLRHELRPPPRAEVWDAVNADSTSCSRKHCDHAKCFYQRAKARLRAANVVIINHALLFALINTGGAQAGGATHDARGVLFVDDFLVLDEAHTVPEVATDHFGLSLSSYGVERALKHLFNPRTKRGVLKKFGDAAAQQLVVDALESSKQFFDFLAGSLLAPRPIVRVREPDVAEPVLDGPLGALHRLLGKLGGSSSPTRATFTGPSAAEKSRRSSRSAARRSTSLRRCASTCSAAARRSFAPARRWRWAARSRRLPHASAPTTRGRSS
jgi:ATP-dependent DNA helicase DinG